MMHSVMENAQKTWQKHADILVLRHIDKIEEATFHRFLPFALHLLHYVICVRK